MPVSRRLKRIIKNILLKNKFGNISKKEYELKDHLGNVHVTVSDRKLSTGFANLLSYTNYYAFGTELTGKSYNPTSYTFAYNGKLKDDDIFNTSGSSYDYGEREFDVRGIPSPFSPAKRSMMLRFCISGLRPLIPENK